MAEGSDPQAEIALFLGQLSGGGAERVIVTLANGFVRRGHSVDLVLANLGGPYLEDVDPLVRVVDLDARSTLRALPALTGYLRDARPQVMLTTLHHTAIAVLLARRLAGSSVRVYLREANTLSAMRPSTIRGRLLLAAARHVYRAADGAIAVSEGVANDLREFDTPGRVHTIYNPVVGPELRRKSQSRVGHRWLEDRRSRVVLAAGRLTEQKDFGTLIDAFAMLEDPHLKLIILGEGRERAALQNLIESLGLKDRVDMPGFVANPFAYMSRASLFVLSSRWEGMPGVLIQAMACGCPVVSTDCPSGPAEVLRGGELGGLVPVGDAAALAAAMDQRLANPGNRNALVERAADFSEDASVEAYLDLLLTRSRDRESRILV